MSTNSDITCGAVAPLLAARVHARLAGEDAACVERHLGECAPCRATSRALAVAWRAGAEPGADLWPRLRARMARADERVRLRLPPVTWPVAAAAAAAAAILMIVPEPARFLAACGVL